MNTLDHTEIFNLKEKMKIQSDEVEVIAGKIREVVLSDNFKNQIDLKTITSFLKFIDTALAHQKANVKLYENISAEISNNPKLNGILEMIKMININ